MIQKEMSFSGMVKEELFRQIGSARHCKMAELAAMLCSCGKMEYFSGESKLKIQTENEAVARKCFTLLQKTFNIETKIFVRENSHLKRVKVYTIEITDPEEIQVIFQALRLVTNSIDQGTLVLSDMLVVQQNCCKRAFIRGAFLASGSISDPEKGYHFEIVYPDEKKAELVFKNTREAEKPSQNNPDTAKGKTETRQTEQTKQKVKNMQSVILSCSAYFLNFRNFHIIFIFKNIIQFFSCISLRPFRFIF